MLLWELDAACRTGGMVCDSTYMEDVIEEDVGDTRQEVVDGEFWLGVFVCGVLLWWWVIFGYIDISDV